MYKKKDQESSFYWGEASLLPSAPQRFIVQCSSAETFNTYAEWVRMETEPRALISVGIPAHYECKFAIDLITDRLSFSQNKESFPSFSVILIFLFSFSKRKWKFWIMNVHCLVSVHRKHGFLWMRRCYVKQRSLVQKNDLVFVSRWSRLPVTTSKSGKSLVAEIIP